MSLRPDIGDLLSRLPVSGQARSDLLRRMRAPGRHYHSDRHLALLWHRHRVFGHGGPFRQPAIERLIASAIAFHDAVLNPGHPDNEAEAAALWRRQASSAARLTPAEIKWVAMTIEATAQHLAPWPSRTLLDRARLWILDLDLTPLGERPSTFADDVRRLRAESAHLDEASWLRQRLGYLEQYVRAPRVFRTPVLARAFEARAQANLQHTFEMAEHLRNSQAA